MPTVPRPVNLPPVSALRLWIADLSGELSLARKMLKLAQELEQTGRANTPQPTAKSVTPTPSTTNAR